MAVYRIGDANVELRVVGAGLRGGALPSNVPPAWDFPAKSGRNLRAFNRAGWQFQRETDVNWQAAEDLNGPLVRGLLAQHLPSESLVILRDWLVLQIRSGVSAAEAASLLQRFTRVRDLEIGDRLFEVKLGLQDSNLEAQILHELTSLSQDQRIDFAEPSILYHIGAPDPPEVLVDDDFDIWHWTKIGVQQAWGKWSEGRGRRVAIVDEGFYSDDPQISPNVEWRLTLDPQGDVESVDSVPKHYHGTMCAGLIGAARDGKGVSGAAPACQMGLVALADFCVCTQVALGIALRVCAGLSPLAKKVPQWEKADVISCCLGITGKNWELSPALKMAINSVVNESRGHKGTPIVWATYDSDDQIQSWAVEGYGPLIIVSQSDNGDMRVGSAWGDGLDLLAPGYLVPVILYDAKGKRRIKNLEGASLAAPLVAGVAALVLAANSDLTASEVAEVITSSCDHVGKFSQYPNTKVGWGRLNAVRAVEQALRRRKESESMKSSSVAPAQPCPDSAPSVPPS